MRSKPMSSNGSACAIAFGMPPSCAHAPREFRRALHNVRATIVPALGDDRRRDPRFRAGAARDRPGQRRRREHRSRRLRAAADRDRAQPHRQRPGRGRVHHRRGAVAAAPGAGAQRRRQRRRPRARRRDRRPGRHVADGALDRPAGLRLRRPRHRLRPGAACQRERLVALEGGAGGPARAVRAVRRRLRPARLLQPLPRPARRPLPDPLQAEPAAGEHRAFRPVRRNRPGGGAEERADRRRLVRQPRARCARSASARCTASRRCR